MLKIYRHAIALEATKRQLFQIRNRFDSITQQNRSYADGEEKTFSRQDRLSMIFPPFFQTINRDSK